MNVCAFPLNKEDAQERVSFPYLIKQYLLISFFQQTIIGFNALAFWEASSDFIGDHLGAFAVYRMVFALDFADYGLYSGLHCSVLLLSRNDLILQFITLLASFTLIVLKRAMAPESYVKLDHFAF